MAEAGHIVEFLYDVFTNWVLLAGGAVMTVLAIGERLLKKEVHWRIYVKILVCFLFVAFYLSWRDATIKLKSQPLPVTPPLTVDVTGLTDTEARKKIGDLEREMAATKGALRNTVQTGGNLFEKPLAAARFTVLINFKTAKEGAFHYMGSGVVIAMGVGGGDALLFVVANDHFSDGNGHSRAVVDCPSDGPSMGKPIQGLSKADRIEIEFSEDFVPLGTELAEGKVLLLLNNEITLAFEIPAQKITEKIRGLPSLVVTGLKKGLEPITPL